MITESALLTALSRSREFIERGDTHCSEPELLCTAIVRTLEVMATKVETRAERLQLRLSATDDGLIRAAAEALHVSISEFVLQAARMSAANTLADRTHVVLDAKTWDALERRVSRKGVRNPKTAELFTRPSPLRG